MEAVICRSLNVKTL